MSPLATVLLFCLILGTLFAPRRWAVVSFLVGALYLTYNAGLQIAGFNTFPTRLLAYCCFLRVVFRKELSGDQLLPVDKSLIALYSFASLMLLARGDGSPALAIAKALDGILTYLSFRALIKGPEDFRWLCGVLVVLMVPYVALLGIERVTHDNLFKYVGAQGEAWIREGKLRCYGSFRHPSLLGSLGACFLPVFIGVMRDPAQRNRMILGVVLCLAIVFFSNSGGPTSVVAVAVVGWVMWRIRTRMKEFRRGFLALIILLALVMKAPVWYLIARVSSITGGTGWHRSYLMDMAFQHLHQWFLMGMRGEDTFEWFPYVLPTTAGADITNQFLVFGIEGGLLAMVLFIYFLYHVFSLLGRALAVSREVHPDASGEWLLWGLGVGLAAHISNWFGISYFDQMHGLWLLQMGATVSISHAALDLADVGIAEEQGSESSAFADPSPA